MDVSYNRQDQLYGHVDVHNAQLTRKYSHRVLDMLKPKPKNPSYASAERGWNDVPAVRGTPEPPVRS